MGTKRAEKATVRLSLPCSASTEWGRCPEEAEGGLGKVGRSPWSEVGFAQQKPEGSFFAHVPRTSRTALKKALCKKATGSLHESVALYVCRKVRRRHAPGQGRPYSAGVSMAVSCSKPTSLYISQ